MKSYKSIKSQIAKLEKQAALMLRSEAAGVISKIKGLMVQYGLSIADLGGAHAEVKTRRRRAANGTKPAKKTVGVARFKDPASGKTWTGRGKPPAWIAGIADRTPFLIDGAAATTAPAAKKPAGKKAAAKKVGARKAPAKRAAAKKAARKSTAASPATT